MNVLVTGGAGFIGYHLARKLLEKGHSVTLLDNFSRGVEDRFLKELSAHPQIELYSLDLLDKTSLNNLGSEFDYIYHLAAIIGVKNVLSAPYEVLRKNVELLLNVIDFAKSQKHLDRLIFFSTSEVYAGTLEYFSMDVPTPEATPLAVSDLKHPRTSYMLSKIYGEALVRQSGLPFTIVRPHNFYGARMGMSHVIPELLRKAYFAANDEGLEVFSVDHRRTFCYIDDAVEMILRLAENSSAINEVYNVGNEGPEITIRHLAEIILQVVQKPMNIVPRPATSGSPERRCPNMKKTWDCIQFKGIISLEEGIQRTFDWYRSNIFDGNETSAK